MKNDILTSLDEATGKYQVFLYSYELTPSEAIRPILRLSTAPVFETEEEGKLRVWNDLTPEARENTNDPRATV